MNNNLNELNRIDASLAERWDQEWLHYFRESNPLVYFISYQDLEIISDLRGKPSLEVYESQLVRSKRWGPMGNLNIWMEGNDLIGSNLLEIGCGPGFAGKQLGLIAALYVGIDYSPLALSIARLTSPSNCHYYHMSEMDSILRHANSLDFMVARHFFIHQNYRNAKSVMCLASMLLKPGGLISADFYLVNPNRVPQPVTHPANGDLDPLLPSCSFLFSVEEIENIARETGFVIKKTITIPRLERRFVLFEKKINGSKSPDMARLVELRLQERVSFSQQNESSRDELATSQKKTGIDVGKLLGRLYRKLRA